MGATFQTVDIPEDMKEQAQEYHSKMIETVVEMDDDILEAYLEVGTSSGRGGEVVKGLLQSGIWRWSDLLLALQTRLPAVPARHPGSRP